MPTVNVPVDLPERFPAVSSGIFFQKDHPITFLHRHDALEIGYCHRGAGIFIVESKIIPFGQGDVIVITGNETHLAQSRKNTTSTWTWIYCDPAQLLIPYFPDPRIIDLSAMTGPGFNNIFRQTEHPRITGTVMDIIDEFSHKRLFREPVIRNLIGTALALVHRSLSRVGNGSVRRRPGATDPSLERIRPAVEHICSHYSETMTIGALARICSMSVTNFRRIFRRVMRATPNEYVVRIRCSMAAVELRNGTRKISAVAFSCGFFTLSSFNRHFRRIMGKTPKRWRAG